ncbi:hypothetical protein ES707_02831 [subsurface metagenome]
MFTRLSQILHTHRNTIIVYLVVIAILLLLFWAAQAAGKTLWEYLEILIIPLVIGIAAFWFQRTVAKRDKAIEKAARERDEAIKEAAIERGLEIESDRQRQATLATYFDRMSDLLINNRLRELEEGSEVRTVAKARTVSALRNLDGKRIAQVIQFLTESSLGGEKLLTIELLEADLQKVDLRGADLQGASLWVAKLQGTNLQGAKLQKAILIGANLQGAILWGANLQGANLRDAQVSPEQLAEARSLKNATMPDGTRYEDWIAKGKPDWSKGAAKQQADEPEENDLESEDEA